MLINNVSTNINTCFGDEN